MGSRDVERLLLGLLPAVALGCTPAGPPEHQMPTCPGRTECIAAELAAKITPPGSEQAAGCGLVLEDGVKVEAIAKGEPGLANFVGQYPSNARFDKAETDARRANGEAEACCYSWIEQCPGGRPLLDEAKQPLVAEFRAGRSWNDGEFVVGGSAEALALAAAAWLEDAAMEHASVASFGRVALELMSLGAPPELLEQTHRAAIDELRHTKRCLAIARACGAAPHEPGALPPFQIREPDLARFAADTFVEACVQETTAALVMERAAAGVEDPALRSALREIAADEAAHASLGWRTLAWAIGEGGTEVLDRVRASAARLRETLGAQAMAASDAVAVPQAGRLSGVELAAGRRDAWLGLVEPLLAKVEGAALHGGGAAKSA